MNGEVPQGTTVASAIAPATTQTILGVDPKGTSLLRLVSPSGDAHVSVSVADSAGVHPLGGGNATVAEGSTLEMPLDGASKDSTPIALIVSSDREVVAQTTTITLGAPWAERANAWIMRSSAAPATLLTQAAIPGRASLEPWRLRSCRRNRYARHRSRLSPVLARRTRASCSMRPSQTGDEAVAQENGDGEQSAAPTPTATPNIWLPPHRVPRRPATRVTRSPPASAHQTLALSPSRSVTVPSTWHPVFRLWLSCPRQPDR